MDNNNLSVSSEDYKGSDIYKGIHNDDLEKDKLAKGEFSEKPNPKEPEKPLPPTVEETHADESKALELKQQAAAKMDKKFDYDSLPTSEKRALRILLNIEGKSAKEKIEGVMEHFGVSKLGAINILADATNHIKEEFPEDDEELPEEGMEDPNVEGEKDPAKESKEHSGTHKKLKEDAKDGKLDTSKEKLGKMIDKDHKKDKLQKGESSDIYKAFGIDGDYLEKGRGLPIGTINKYGEVKTGDGWKHIKNHEKGEHHGAAIEHAKKSGEHVTPDHDKHPSKMGSTPLDEKTGGDKGKEGSFDEKAHTKKAEQLNKEKKDLAHAAWANPSNETRDKHEAKLKEIKEHRATKKEAQKKKISDAVDKVTGGGEKKWSDMNDAEKQARVDSSADKNNQYNQKIDGAKVRESMAQYNENQRVKEGTLNSPRAKANAIANKK